jgi:hypothetical protein
MRTIILALFVMFQQNAFAQTKSNANKTETLALQINKYSVKKDSELRSYILNNTNLIITYTCIPEGIVILGYKEFEKKSINEFIKSKLFSFDAQLEYSIIDSTDLNEIESKCARTRTN